MEHSVRSLKIIMQLRCSSLHKKASFITMTWYFTPIYFYGHAAANIIERIAVLTIRCQNTIAECRA